MNVSVWNTVTNKLPKISNDSMFEFKSGIHKKLFLRFFATTINLIMKTVGTTFYILQSPILIAFKLFSKESPFRGYHHIELNRLIFFLVA